MSLSTRISAFFLAMLGTVLVGFSVSLYFVADRYLRRQAQERLEAAADTLVAAAERGPEGVEWEPGERRLSFESFASPGQLLWLVTDDKGRRIDGSRGSDIEQLLAQSDEFGHGTGGLRDFRQREWRNGKWKVRRQWVIQAPTPTASSGRPADDRSGQRSAKYSAVVITVGISLVPVDALLSRLAATLTCLTLGIWFISFFIGRAVCSRALQPVTRMAAAAGEINADDLSRRLPVAATNDQLEKLGRAFNCLLDRLEESFERQRRFTGDASHQLRTPLAAILGQIEVTLRRERPPEEYRRILMTVHERVGHLRHISESLLFMARANGDGILPPCEDVCLQRWLRKHLEAWREHPRGSDVTFRQSDDPRVFVRVPPALLGELVDILIDNACKYSAPGSEISIRVARHNETAALSVRDRGFGIAEAELIHLFNPFYRSENVRRLGIDGTGLGLSIAQRLSQLLRGALTVQSHVGLGSCFELRLPLARPVNLERDTVLAAQISTEKLLKSHVAVR